VEAHRDLLTRKSQVLRLCTGLGEELVEGLELVKMIAVVVEEYDGDTSAIVGGWYAREIELLNYAF